MSWVLVLGTIALLVALARAFFLSARAIRRDLDERFERIRVEIEKQASAVVDELSDENEAT